MSTRYFKPNTPQRKKILILTIYTPISSSSLPYHSKKLYHSLTSLGQNWSHAWLLSFLTPHQSISKSYWCYSQNLSLLTTYTATILDKVTYVYCTEYCNSQYVLSLLPWQSLLHTATRIIFFKKSILLFHIKHSSEFPLRSEWNPDF